MSDTIGKVPKVFISYSWVRSEQVLELAERLMNNHVEVVLDKWDLKEGQDKYAFMEKCVVDPEIDRVLLICDKTYTDKANARDGGVGDETVIISSEVYGRVNQEKFIPVIYEKDENSNPCMPAYIMSRIYIDLTSEDSYESEYEKLLRNIHKKPLFKKPALGPMPDWLEDEAVNFTPVRDLIKQLRGCPSGNGKKYEFLVRNLLDAISFALCSYNSTIKNDVDLLRVIDELKLLRDYYTDFIEIIIYSNIHISDTITSFFEEIYNTSHDAKGKGSYGKDDFEFADYFIWECFIVTAAVLLHYEKFEELHDVLCHSYFLRDTFFDEYNLKHFDYSKFRTYISTIENICKPKCDEPKLYTLTGRMLIQREKKPILTSRSLSAADIILYQLHNVLVPGSESYWFPTSYGYCKEGATLWSRLKSNKYCVKVFPLFGVKSIDELKNKISECKKDRDMRHKNAWDAAPNILNSVSLDEIGTIF